MKEESVYKKFASEHSIVPDCIKGSEIQAIYWLERISQLYLHSANKEEDRLIYEPSWGFIHSMLDRIYEHVSSSFIQYCLGFPASGEIIARTAIESSINTLYVMQSVNPVEKILEYLTSYIDQERSQNTRWKNVVNQIATEEQSIYLAALSQKAQYLDKAEGIVTSLCQTELSIPYPSPNSWGNIRDRFVAVGKEMTYRTTYAAASSQVHSDAEDLLNEFLVIFSHDPDSTKTKLAVETSNFSRMIIYQGLHYYFETINKYCNIFRLKEPVSEIDVAQKWVDEFSVKVAKTINSTVK
jgi:hypothetical protein